MIFSPSRLIAPAPTFPSINLSSISLNSIHEIDHELSKYVNFFFQMRDPSLRKEYETFNDRNQSLPSLLWLNLFLLAATTLISLIILLTLAYGKVIVGWVSLLIGTVVLNAFVFYAYVHLKKTVKQNNYTLPDRSRKFLKWLHIAIFILIQFFICRRMLAKSLAGECDEDEEKDLLGDWRCNPQHNSASLPSGISLCVMLWPIFHVVCVRGAYIGWTLLMWVSGVGCMITAIVLGGLTGSTSSTVVYIVTSLFIIAELKRQNYVMYFLDRRLQTMLREKERQTDEENATEMRHMIANVAHDLKTPLSSFLAGIEHIGHVIEEVRVKQQIHHYNITTANSPTHHSLAQSSADIEDFIQSIAQCITNMGNTNSFMLMTINRCIDYTKASKGLKLVPKFETIDLLDTLSLPLNCMKDIQNRVAIQLLAIPRDVCSHVITDKQWLQENVLCLLSNAVKYSDGGEVTLSINRQHVDPAEADEISLGICRSASSVDPDDYTHLSAHTSRTAYRSSMRSHSDEGTHILRFEVEDHGIGLSDEMMQTLFSPFKQAQRLAGGTGLGLFSLANRVQALGGKCGVSRRRDGGEGSMFWFTIPYRPDSTVGKKILMSNCTYKSAVYSPRIGIKSQVTSHSQISPELQPHMALRAQMLTASQESERMPLDFDGSIKGCGSSSYGSTSTKQVPYTSIESLCDGGSGVTSASRKPLCILLVDDSPAILKMTSMMLRRQKHTVYTATNGAEAVKIVQESMRGEGGGMEGVGAGKSMTTNTTLFIDTRKPKQHVAFDVILMDLQMPVMDGLEATRRIRRMDEQGGVGGGSGGRENKHHVIIGVSANSDIETAQEAYKAGIDAFITKPFELEVFYRTYQEMRIMFTSTTERSVDTTQLL